MNQLLADSVSRSRFATLLLGIFAVVALLLASVASMVSCLTQSRSARMRLGIRIALGATRRNVVGTGSPAWDVVGCLVVSPIGLLGSLGLTRLFYGLAVWGQRNRFH